MIGSAAAVGLEAQNGHALRVLLSDRQHGQNSRAGADPDHRDDHDEDLVLILTA